MKKIFLYVASIFLVGNLSAQTITDALRFSQMGLNGTSNYISRAGAIGALGGDLTAASYNPAGLGVYNSNELSLSTGLYWSFTDANSNGLVTSDNRANFNLGHIAALFYFKPRSNDFKAVQFAFGLNRLKSYGNRTIYERDGLNYSYVSNIIANGYSDAFMHDFYQSYVVDSAGGNYTSVYQNGKFNQLRSITESGSVNEMTFSLSTNIRNFLYLGATIGVPMVNYHSEGSFMEKKVDNAGNITDQYTYNETKDIYATGVNLKLGAIIRPVNWFRLGLAIHTPTYYSIEDNLYSEVSSYQWISGGDWDPIKYHLQTPFRFLGSMAFILGDNKSKLAGSISADYEYADYSKMKYRLNNNISTESEINKLISDYFQATNTLRIGGEVKLGTIALRAGYCIMDNPYSKDLNDAGAYSITGGLGYKNKNFFMDFAYAYTYGKSKFNEYDQSVINLENTSHLAQLTFGVKF
ncbi:MAG: hypothetical protein WC679_05565 [Bacteroidales bacterium]|jgi:hypothetical protein